MRWFVRQSIKGGGCTAFKQFYKSNKAENVFEIISRELNVQGIICEIVEAYIKYVNDFKKQLEKQNDSIFKDYRNINVKK